MHALRFERDKGADACAIGALGADAEALGRRVLIAAQTAAAMHVAEITRRQLWVESPAAAPDASGGRR